MATAFGAATCRQQVSKETILQLHSGHVNINRLKPFTKRERIVFLPYR